MHTFAGRIILLTMLSTMALQSSAAPSEESPFYFKLDIGGGFTEDTELKVNQFPGTPYRLSGRADLRFDPGARVGFSSGYSVTDWLAIEAELGGMISSFKAGNVRNGTFANVPLLFNLKFQYPNRSRWTPYIGAGLGVSAAIIDADILIANDSFNTYQRLRTRDADAVFAYQGFGGLRYKLNARMDLGLEYRYFVAESPKWVLDQESASIEFGGTQTHAISFAFQLRF